MNFDNIGLKLDDVMMLIFINLTQAARQVEIFKPLRFPTTPAGGATRVEWAQFSWELLCFFFSFLLVASLVLQ